MSQGQFSGSMIFHGINFHTATKQATEFNAQQINEAKSKENTFCWIDIQSKNIDDFYHCLAHFDNALDLHQDFERPEILPRISEKEDCFVFFLYEITDPEKHLDTSHALTAIKFARIVLVLSADYIITYHRVGISAVDYVKSVSEESFKLAGKTPAFIIFLFLQRCLYDYSHLNLANDNFLDKLEFAIYQGKPKEIERDISISGLNILTLKKLTANINIILMVLVTKINPFIGHEARSYFHEMLQNVTTTRNAIDSSRVLLDGIIASVQAHSSSRTREIMRFLTVISAIFLPLSLVAGLYGMNFNIIPGKSDPEGFYLIVGSMIVTLVVMLNVFYFIGWIGQRKQRK